MNIVRIIPAILLWLMATGVSAQTAKDSIQDEFYISDELPTVITPEDKDYPVIDIADSVKISKEIAKKERRDWTTWKPDPKRAMWLAIILPGAGQIYNRKYWKLPIVYGGFLGCAYAMRWNNQMYHDYSQAYLDIMDDDPNTKSYMQFIKLSREITPADEDRYKRIFKSRKDRYRRWRDMSFFVMLGVYGLSIVDAYVDAQLSQFDISDDLSLRLEPAVLNGGITNGIQKQSPMKGLGNSAIGLQGALIF